MIPRQGKFQTTEPDDWLVHTLWDHYPEALPAWSETPPHIREGLIEMARKVREAFLEHA